MVSLDETILTSLKAKGTRRGVLERLAFEVPELFLLGTGF